MKIEKKTSDFYPGFLTAKMTRNDVNQCDSVALT